jgi:hypothetical protein
MKVAKTSNEYFELEFVELIDILRADELNIKNESDLFEIITKWIDFDPTERKKVI